MIFNALFFVNLGFVILGIYLYLLITGVVKPTTEKQRLRIKKMNEGSFGKILRFLLIIMIVVMILNIAIPY